MTHNYYELLYAFHVYRHNYRKGKAWDGTSYLPTHLGHPFPAPARCVASPGCRLMHFSLFSAGTVMFEYGMRLGREVRTLRGLQKQGNCFLAAINCLRLIRPEYAWIVQPASGAVVRMQGASKILSDGNRDIDCTSQSAVHGQLSCPACQPYPSPLCHSPLFRVGGSRIIFVNRIDRGVYHLVLKTANVLGSVNSWNTIPEES